LGTTGGLRADSFGEQLAQGGNAFGFDDVEGVRKLAIPYDAAVFEQAFQGLEQCFGLFQTFGGTFQFDPVLAGDGFDSQFIMQRLEVARFVVEGLLRQAGGFEMERFSGHREIYLASAVRNCAATSDSASGSTVVLPMTGMKLVSPDQRGTMWTWT
jgi:hypothetical protein